MRNAKGMVRGYDVRTGKRLWIFHTIPRRGEFGYDTWLEESAEYNGNTGVWAQMSADAELGLVYVPVEMPTGDYYGGNRPGNNLFADSLVALDVKTGKRKWHYQTVHHDVWDWDLACAPILFDMKVNGRTVKAVAQPTKHAFLFVFNRETGEPIWPIEERPVPQSDVPKERTSPTQPFPTKPAPFDRQGVSENDLIDLTPALKAEALEVARRYKMGPLFTPPVVSSLDGPLGTLTLPAEVGGANWPGGSFDPANNHLYIHSHAQVYMNAPRAGDSGTDGHGVRRRTGARRRCRRQALPARQDRGAGGGGRAATVQGLPLIKPPYDQITAYDMNTGEIVWQKTHSSTPDDIRNHPALKGVTLPRLGQPGRTFIGTLTTKNLRDCRRRRRPHERGRPTRRAAACLRQAHGRGRRRGGDAGEADRLADELPGRRQAVHRRRGQRQRWRRVAGLRASVDGPAPAADPRMPAVKRPRARAATGRRATRSSLPSSCRRPP